jgi:hypothetical protein
LYQGTGFSLKLCFKKLSLLPHFAAALVSSQTRAAIFCDQGERSAQKNRFKSVILSGAPEKSFSTIKSLWRVVEGPRRCVLCHADARRSLKNAAAACLLLLVIREAVETNRSIHIYEPLDFDFLTSSESWLTTSSNLVMREDSRTLSKIIKQKSTPSPILMNTA